MAVVSEVSSNFSSPLRKASRVSLANWWLLKSFIDIFWRTTKYLSISILGSPDTARSINDLLQDVRRLNFRLVFGPRSSKIGHSWASRNHRTSCRFPPFTAQCKGYLFGVETEMSSAYTFCTETSAWLNLHFPYQVLTWLRGWHMQYMISNWHYLCCRVSLHLAGSPLWEESSKTHCWATRRPYTPERWLISEWHRSVAARELTSSCCISRIRKAHNYDS